jgi:hypothetical protein
MSAKILSTVELSAIEKIFYTHGSWVIICHAAHLSGNQSIIVKNISQVIPHLLKRHPRMRSRLQVNGYQQSLQVLDYDEEYFNPKLFYSIIETSDLPWQKIAEKECHRNPYTDNGQTIFPLFHFMLILNDNTQSINDNLFHLLLFSNHCASDGRSGCILMNDFLTLVTSSDLRDHIEPVNSQIIPCIHQFIPRPYGILYPLLSPIARYMFKRQARQLHHPRIPVKTTLLEGNATPFRLQPLKLHFIFTSTSTTLYPNLREKCHSQQITLHGPLLACLLLAVHHCFPEKNKNNRYLYPWTLDVDFDMRSRLPQSPFTPSTVGYCVSMSSVKLKKQLPLSSTPFWTLAKKCVSMTNKVLTDGEVYLTQHVLNDIIINEQLFNNLSRNLLDGRASELNFSNIGKYPFSCDYGQGQIRLRGLHVTNGPGIYHASTVLLITCAGDGQLDISLAHEIESEERGQEFLDYYVHLLEKCANADIGITLQELLE